LYYYTGTIFETFINALPQRGSVCSGGRYDDLASTFTKERLPGIGASLGLDRLLSVMEELNLLPQAATPAEVFIPYFDAARLHDYLRLAAAVRGGTYRGADGQAIPLGAEIYPEPKKLGAQLKYADRRGFRVALIAGDREFAAGECQVKDLRTGGSATVSIAEDWTALLGQVRAALEA
jgi:histidyl-tRNA synthetase